jgi:hypothetical protein
MQKYIISRREILVHSNPSVYFPIEIAFADEITLSLVEFELMSMPEYIRHVAARKNGHDIASLCISCA